MEYKPFYYKVFINHSLENHLVIAVLVNGDLKPHHFINVLDGLDIFFAARILSRYVVDDHTMTKHLWVEYGVHTPLVNQK